MPGSTTNRGRIIAQIRARKALGLTSKRRRIPRPLQPNAIRLSYFQALRPFLQRARALVERMLVPFLPRILNAGRASTLLDVRTDTKSPLLSQILERIQREMLDVMKPHELERLALTFAGRTSTFQREQLQRQTRAALGVDLNSMEPNLAPVLDAFAAENVELITSLPTQYLDDLRLQTEEAVASGVRAETLADTFVERYGIAENRAMLIANDQIGKLTGNLNEVRQEALGINSYTWRIVGDNRVRDEHEALEGEVFDWTDEPPDGHPGQAINCRCYAEPNVDEILDSL